MSREVRADSWRGRARASVERVLADAQALAPWRAFLALVAAQAQHNRIEAAVATGSEAKRAARELLTRSTSSQARAAAAARIDRMIGREERLVARYRDELAGAPAHAFAVAKLELRRRRPRVWPFHSGYAEKAWYLETDLALRARWPEEQRKRLAAAFLLAMEKSSPPGDGPLIDGGSR